jgi:methionine-rich copper-binding protein CopC
MKEAFMNTNLVRRGMLALALGVAITALMAGPFSSPVLAHNELLKTDPAAKATVKVAPTRVQFWFEEKPDMTVTKIVVKGPSGIVETAVHPVSEKVLAADFKSKLAPGAYTVSWQTAGDDSHISKGEFSFTVAAP